MICYSGFNKKSKITNYECDCGYIGKFHSKCFNKWYKKQKRCIICLDILPKKKIFKNHCL